MSELVGLSEREYVNVVAETGGEYIYPRAILLENGIIPITLISDIIEEDGETKYNCLIGSRTRDIYHENGNWFVH